MSTLHIIRGLPGSGKSTFAKTFECLHLEADMYFQRGGDYMFKQDALYLAHKWCQETARKCLDMGMDVVVSNTFTTMRELNPYLSMPAHTTLVYRCTQDFGSTHDVPDEVIQRMKERFVDYEQEHLVPKR